MDEIGSCKERYPMGVLHPVALKHFLTVIKTSSVVSDSEPDGAELLFPLRFESSGQAREFIGQVEPTSAVYDDENMANFILSSIAAIQLTQDFYEPWFDDLTLTPWRRNILNLRVCWNENTALFPDTGKMTPLVKAIKLERERGRLWGPADLSIKAYVQHLCPPLQKRLLAQAKFFYLLGGISQDERNRIDPLTKFIVEEDRFFSIYVLEKLLQFPKAEWEEAACLTKHLVRNKIDHSVPVLTALLAIPQPKRHMTTWLAQKMMGDQACLASSTLSILAEFPALHQELVAYFLLSPDVCLANGQPIYTLQLLRLIHEIPDHERFQRLAMVAKFLLQYDRMPKRVDGRLRMHHIIRLLTTPITVPLIFDTDTSPPVRDDRSRLSKKQQVLDLGHIQLIKDPVKIKTILKPFLARFKPRISTDSKEVFLLNLIDHTLSLGDQVIPIYLHLGSVLDTVIQSPVPTR